MGNLFGGGDQATVDTLTANSKEALAAGGPLVKAGVSGKGTPFQQASIKSFTDQATANLKTYEGAAGIKDQGAGGAAQIAQEADVLLNRFTTEDIQTGAGFLEQAITSDTAAQKIQMSQDQMMGQALMSAAEIVAMILVA